MPKVTRKDLQSAADSMLDYILESPNAAIIQDFAMEQLERDKGKAVALSARFALSIGAGKSLLKNHIEKHYILPLEHGTLLQSLEKQGWSAQTQAETAVLATTLNNLVFSKVFAPKNQANLAAWLEDHPNMLAPCRNALMVSGTLKATQLDTAKEIATQLCNAENTIKQEDLLHFGSALLGRAMPHQQEWKHYKHSQALPGHKTGQRHHHSEALPETIAPPPRTPQLPKQAHSNQLG